MKCLYFCVYRKKCFLLRNNGGLDAILLEWVLIKWMYLSLFMEHQKQLFLFLRISREKGGFRRARVGVE